MFRKTTVIIIMFFVLILMSGCQKDDFYKVNFNTNGGAVMDSINVSAGEKISIPDPVKEGFVFSGWYKSQDDLIPFDINSTINDNITLYADWATEGITYTLYNDDTEYEVLYQNDEEIEVIQIPKNYMGIPVTKISDYGLGGNPSVTEIILPNSVNIIGIYALMGCGSLTSFSFSKYVTEIGFAVFFESVRLESISVDPDNQNYKSIDGVLFDKTGELLVTYPAGKTDSNYTINNTVVTIGDYAFSKNIYLTNVVIGTSVTTIKTHAFYNCWELTSIIIPNNVTSLETYAFRNCVGLTSITLGTGISGLNAYLFNGCNSLTSITLPSNIDYIGYGAFYDCTGLSVIIIDKTASQGIITSGIFMITNTKSYLVFYVPDFETMEAYQADSNWAYLANKILVNPAS